MGRENGSFVRSHKRNRPTKYDPRTRPWYVLAKENPGLCVITTREPVYDLANFTETTQEIDLEQISEEAGRALLRVGGVQGTDVELEGAARDFGLHALALNLLAAYIHEIPGHRVSNAAESRILTCHWKKGNIHVV